MDNNISLDPDFLDESSKSNFEDYICCICQMIPDPDTAEEEENCGHIFCKPCINDWLIKSQNCPFCKKKISQRSIKDKNKLVYRHLINLGFLCQETGCKWKGTLKEYINHLKMHNNSIFKMIEKFENFGVGKENKKNNFELYKYYKATVHQHPLKFLDITMSNKWSCDGRNLPSKCLNGITDFDHTDGIKRFRCFQCDFDLCEVCMINYLDKTYEIIENESNNRGLCIIFFV